MQSVDEILSGVLSRLERKLEEAESTGWPLMDKLLINTGVIPKHTVLIGDDSNDVYAGLLNMVVAQVDAGKKVLLISTDKQRNDLLGDLLLVAGNLSRTQITTIDRRNLPKQCINIIRAYESRQFSCVNLEPHEFSLSIKQCANKNSSGMTDGYDLIAIDSLHSFITGEFNNFYEEFSSILRKLNILCKRDSISLVYGSSANRRGRPGKISATNIRDSGVAEELADLVVSVDRYKTRNSNNQRMLRLVKPLFPGLVQLKCQMNQETMRLSV